MQTSYRKPTQLFLFANTGRFSDSHRTFWKTHHGHAGLCFIISLLQIVCLNALGSHVGFGMSLKPWHCCVHLFSQCSSLMTYWTGERPSHWAQGLREYQSACRVVPGPLRKDIKNSRGIESRQLLFTLFMASPAGQSPFSVVLFTVSGLCGLHSNSRSGCPWLLGCHCLSKHTWPFSFSLGLLLPFLFQGGESACLDEKSPSLLFSMLWFLFFCAQIKLCDFLFLPWEENAAIHCLQGNCACL